MKERQNRYQELNAPKQTKPHRQRLTIGYFSTEIQRDYALWVTFPLKTLRSPNGFEAQAHLIGELVEASRSWTLRNPMASGIGH